MVLDRQGLENAIKERCSPVEFPDFAARDAIDNKVSDSSCDTDKMSSRRNRCSEKCHEIFSVPIDQSGNDQIGQENILIDHSILMNIIYGIEYNIWDRAFQCCP
jgi:hypothetical protein